MKRFLKKALLLAGLLTGFHQLQAQVPEKALQQKAFEAADPGSHVKSIRTNVFVDKYQALLKSGMLTQSGAGVKISSTLYGIFKLFDSTIAIDTNYTRYKWGRNVAIGAGITLGDQNKVTAVNPSLTWAVVNGRELSVKKHRRQWAAISNYVNGYEALLTALEQAVNANTLTPEQLRRIDSFNVKQDVRLLQGIVPGHILAGAQYNQRLLDSSYERLARDIRSGPLLTVGIDGNYGGNAWSTLDAKAELLTGAGFRKDSNHNWDFYSGAFLSAAKDTAAPSNLERQQFSVKSGLNKVLLKTRDRQNSLLEALVTAEYRNILKGTYAGETQHNLLLNLTLSVRLAADFYLPVEVKYNPASGQFLGFIDLKVDIRKVFLRAEP